MSFASGVQVPVKDSGTTTDPQLHANAGLSQLSGVTLSSGTGLEIYLQAQINASSLTNTTTRPVFFSVVLQDSGAGNDYWWDYENRAWTDYGSALTDGYHDPNDAAFASQGVNVLSKVFLTPRRVADIVMEMPSLPTAGNIRISLYNVVETQDLLSEEITGVTWYRAQIQVTGGGDEEALSTRTVATDTSSGNNRHRPDATFWTGQGPSNFHDSRITYGGGTIAENWKKGGYSAAEGASGDSLDKLHGAVILASRYTPLERLRCQFRVDSGDLWPHQPLKYGSTYYSIIEMQWDVRFCEYQIEATEVISPTVSDTTTSEYRPFSPGVPSAGAGQETFYVPAVGRSHIYMRGVEGDLDDIDDGSTYAKVLATSITAGQVTVASLSGDLDDIADGATYGKILSSALSSGAALLSQAVGDLDDVADGSTYGKVNVTSISAGNILLAQATGDLDDIADGTYGKVLATNISAGNIILANVSGDTDDLTAGSNTTVWNKNGVPPTATSVGGSGLYLGTDKLGFYDASGTPAWKTYMDSTGKFYLGGASGKLQWDGSSLTIDGDGTFSGSLSAAAGTFEGNLSGSSMSLSGNLAVAGTLTVGAAGTLANNSGDWSLTDGGGWTWTAGSSGTDPTQLTWQTNATPDAEVDVGAEGTTTSITFYIRESAGTLTYENGASSATYSGTFNVGSDAKLTVTPGASNVTASLLGDSGSGGDATLNVTAYGASNVATIAVAGSSGATGTITVDGSTVWHAGNDGSGSSLDADLLDGYHESSFAKLADNETVSGTWDFTNTITAPGMEHGSGTMLFENTAASAEMHWKVNSAAGNQTLMRWKFDTTDRMVLDSDGDMTCNSVTETSDLRLKENVEDLGMGLATLCALRPVTYNRIDIDSDERFVGLIAQEVQKAFPMAVKEGEEYLGVRYTKLIPLIISAIKELDERTRA